MAEMKTLNGYEVVDAAARADIELLKAKDTAIQADLNNHTHSYNDLTDKPTIPSTAGLASEAYVDEAIAAIPKPSGIEFVEVTTSNTAEELQAILDAGKCPIFKGVMTYQGSHTPYFDGQPGEKFYLFIGVSLVPDASLNDNKLYPHLTAAKCYPNRTGYQWETSTSYRLTTYSEYFALERRVAALEGGNN